MAYICIYGSQNYGLDVYTNEYQSDIDMKAVIVPTLDNLISNSKPVSIIVDTEWGQCDIKDIRAYFETLLKANPAYIETLFTDHYVVDDNFNEEFREIFEKRDSLVYTLRAQLIRAMYGMMCEKEKALCHPYPATIYKIEKFGYDGKQASHALRLWLMMQDYFEYKLSFSFCLYPRVEYRQILLDLKFNKYSLDEVKSLVRETVEKAKKFRDKILSTINEQTIDYSVKDEFLELSRSIIKKKIVAEIKGVN